MRYLYLLGVFAVSVFISHHASAFVYDAETQLKAIDTVTTVDCSDKDSDPNGGND